MNSRVWQLIFTGVTLSLTLWFPDPAHGCCVAPRSGRPVVNADQTVIIIWDAAKKMQHFIRKASFKSDGADDFGFLIPSPTQPELSESGNEAFSYLENVTAPDVRKAKSRAPTGFGAAGGMGGMAKPAVRVLDEKLVAGFNAVVLEADSATALTTWLKEHEYAYSPEIEAWAKPYVEGKWKFTALKVAKDKDAGPAGKTTVNANALRMSFETDKPLFMYREPESTAAAKSLGAKRRLLRIYFIASAKFQGDLTPKSPWTGKVVWSGLLSADQRKETLTRLKLPLTAAVGKWWLTEFEDVWPYKLAPADVYFTKSKSQNFVRRPPIIENAAIPAPEANSPKLTAGTR